MIDFEKFDKEDLEFLIALLIAFSHGTEIEFECFGKKYFAEGSTYEITAQECSPDAEKFTYHLPEDFFEGFMIDGKPFIERLRDITSYGIL